MGILAMLEARSRAENPAVPLSSASISEALGLAEPTPAGVTVTQEKALGITAFWCGVGMISQTKASLPLEVFERLSDNTTRPARNHPVNLLLHYRPNRLMSPFSFKELSGVHPLTWGNFYAEKEYNGAGQIVGLWPLLPDRTYPEIKNGEKFFWTVIDGIRIALAADKVLHIPGPGFDGLVGYNPVRLHRDALGLTVAANEYGARFFGNSGKPSGYLEHPGKPNPEERAQYREEWNQIHSGLTNAQRTAVLWGGMKWQAMSIPPEEAQFLGTREMQIEEVARILKINPILLQSQTKATSWGSGVAQFLISYAKFTIIPWLVRDESVMNYELFTPAERGRYYVKYNINALLRGDLEMQARILEIKRRNGIINADEWRELDEENPLPDGKGQYYLVPLNYAPIESLVERPEETLPAPRRALSEGRSMKFRQRQRDAYKGLFEDGAKRFVRRDVEAAAKAIEKASKSGDPVAALNRWIEEFYPGQKRVIIQTMLPIVSALADVIAADAIEESGANMKPDEVQTFSTQYTESLAIRETSSSIGQLRGLTQTEPAEALKDTLLARVGEWVETRPLKVAEREVVAVASGALRFVAQGAGMHMVWHANADACELCQEMDGRRIGSKDYFLKSGESVGAEGKSPLTADQNLGSPPLHESCNCSIGLA